MKKILFLFPFLFLSFCVLAQDEEEPAFKLGLTAHPTLGWIKSDIDNVDGKGVRLGFSYGLLADINFAENYAFSTGLKLTTINGRTETVAGSTNSEQVFKLQYIEIPAKLKLLTNDNNGIKFFGEFGLGNGLNIKAKQDNTSTITADNADNRDIYSQTAFYRGSIIIGAGAEISTTGRTKILAGLSFDNGFTDIKKGDGSLKNAYLGINIGVFF